MIAGTAALEPAVTNIHLDPPPLHTNVVKHVDSEVGQLRIGVQNKTLTGQACLTIPAVLDTKIDRTNSCTVGIISPVDRIKKFKQLALSHLEWKVASKSG